MDTESQQIAINLFKTLYRLRLFPTHYKGDYYTIDDEYQEEQVEATKHVIKHTYEFFKEFSE